MNFLLNVFNSLAVFIENVAIFLGRMLKTNASSFVMLETIDLRDGESPEDCTTLVCNDGSLFSGIRLNGYISCVGKDELNSIIRRLSSGMKAYFSKPGHVCQIWFGIDPSRTRDILMENMQASIVTSREIGLDTEVITRYKADHLAKMCFSESIYIGIWTTRSIMTKEAAKFEKERLKEMKLPVIPPEYQDIFSGVQALRQSHDSLVKSFMADLVDSGLSCKLLNAVEACRAARMSTAAEVTNLDWKPILPGDKIPMRQIGNMDRLELDMIGYPPLYSQLMPFDAVKESFSTVTIGDNTYAPIFVDVPQDEPRRFSELVTRIGEHKIPWRFSMHIESGGEQFLAIKGEIAGLFGWVPGTQNSKIYKAYKALKEIAANEPIVRIRISLCTWAPSNQPDLLRSRVAQLVKSVSGWGRCEVRTVSGDAMAGYMSSTCFLTRESIARAAYAPIEDALIMTPIDRPSSPWQFGAIPFRTIDGKIMPFEPGSSMQTTWNYIGFGSPGTGKSVLASTILMAACQQAGKKRLPRIAITDIGPSSEGFINAIRDMLPDHMKHYVASFRMRMTKDFCVNPCDTHLGMDFLLPDDKSFLVSLITLLATPPEAEESYDSMSSLVSKVIDIMYEETSRNSPSAKRYRPGVCEDVDKVIKSRNLKVDEETTWWSIVDQFFDLGLIHEATLAQRYAVPTIADAISAAKNYSIRDLYTDPKVKTTESLVASFSRMIQDALRDYPVFERPTVFDIGEARIVSIDIDEVAPRGTSSADKQTAVMYMLASYIMTKSWRLSDDPKLIASIPKRYQEFHRVRIAEILEDMKWDVVDEFHRASKVKAANAVIADYIVRMREGRKWKRGVILLSQSISDFPREILEFVSGVFALEGGTRENMKYMQEVFGFNDEALRMLDKYARGTLPGGGGNPFLGIFKVKPFDGMKGGLFTQLLVNTISPIEIWSFSTTREDVIIRKKVFEILGSSEGREALAIAYPSGSAARDVERIASQFASMSEEERDAGISNIIVKKIIEKYEEYKKQKFASETFK